MTDHPNLPGEWQACPRCGDPLITGCRPAADICVVDPVEERTVLFAPGMSALTDEEYALMAATYAALNRTEVTPRPDPVFTASMPGEPACCEQGIDVGDRIRGDGRGGWIHEDCEAP